MNPNTTYHHRASLTVSSEQVAPGQSTSLRWKVLGVEAGIASVHLKSTDGYGLNTVESAPPEGARELLFSRPGIFTFTLIATFGDGTKLNRQVSIHVAEE